MEFDGDPTKVDTANPTGTAWHRVWLAQAEVDHVTYLKKHIFSNSKTVAF